MVTGFAHEVDEGRLCTDARRHRCVSLVCEQELY